MKRSIAAFVVLVSLLSSGTARTEPLVAFAVTLSGPTSLDVGRGRLACLRDRRRRARIVLGCEQLRGAR